MSLMLQHKGFSSEAIHLLLKVGYRFSAEDFVSSKTGKYSCSTLGHRLGDVILQQQGKVPLLSQISRTRIRKHLNYCHGGRGLLRTVSQLPLPPLLRDFLLLKEELGTT